MYDTSQFVNDAVGSYLFPVLVSNRIGHWITYGISNLTQKQNHKQNMPVAQQISTEYRDARDIKIGTNQNIINYKKKPL